MNDINFQIAKFMLSAASWTQFPKDEGAEVAFVGRSNAGKSSALNALTNQKKLARVSRTPGRTQLINFFSINKTNRLVDLPGYGFAKTPIALKNQWHQLIDEYLRSRESLKGLVLLMDIRHPLQPFDIEVLEWTATIDLPVHILLTKADKLSRGAGINQLQKVEKIIIKQFTHCSIQFFSSTTKNGIDDLKSKLSAWLT